MRRVSFFRSLAASSVLVCTSHVCAETFSLGFEAPVGCPSKADLVGQVQARTTLAELVETLGTFRFDVRIAQRAQRSVLGSLSARLPSGKGSVRSIDGDTCVEVVSALAVIMALTVDPGAQSGPLTAQSPAARTETSSVAAAHLESALAHTETTQPTASPPPEAPSPPPAPLPRPAAPARPNTAVTASPDPQAKGPSTSLGQLDAGVQGDWTSLLAPRWGMLRAGAHVTFRSRAGAVATLAVSWGPTTRRSDGNGTEARLNYLGAAVELGFSTRMVDAFTLDALAILSTGLLHAEGLRGGRIAVPDQRNATWLGAGPALELRQNSAWGGWALGASMPIGLIRPQFNLQTSSGTPAVFFQVPPVGIELRLRFFIRLFG